MDSQKSRETKFGVISAGDILVILKKEGSRSVIRVAIFRESLFSPSANPVTMIEYVEIMPEISFEPLMPLEKFENMIRVIKPVMYMSDREWDRFYEFLQHSRSLQIFKEAYEKFKTPDRRVIRRSPFIAYMDFR